MKNLSGKLISIVIILSTLIACGKSENQEESFENKPGNAESADSSYVVDITAADFAYGMPTEIPSGWVTFRMKNEGKHEHHGIIEKYPDSLGFKTLNKMVMQTIGQENRKNMNKLGQLLISVFSGPSIVSPGKTAETTVYLEPGLYAFSCWLVAPDGKYHGEKGMRRTFKVTSEASGTTKPKGTINIKVTDYAIEIEDPVEAGEQVFNVKFDSYHNVHLARLDEGQDFEALKQWMTKIITPSKFTFLGGAEEAPVGMSATFKATLEPGRYALVTYRLAAIGMAEEFIVPQSGVSSVTQNYVVNDTLNIKLNSNTVDLPVTVPTGRTPFVIENTNSVPQQYLLFMVKKGYTWKDFSMFFEKSYINKTIRPKEQSNPGIFIESQVIQPDMQNQFNLQIQERDYVLIGPLSPGMPQRADWNSDLVHRIRGISK